MSSLLKGLLTALTLVFIFSTAQAEEKYYNNNITNNNITVSVILPDLWDNRELSQNEQIEKAEMGKIKHAYLTFYNQGEKHERTEKLRLLINQEVIAPEGFLSVRLSLTDDKGSELFYSYGKVDVSINLFLEMNKFRNEILEVKGNENLFLDTFNSTVMVEFENGEKEVGYLFSLINGKNILSLSEYSDESYWDIMNMPRNIIYTSWFDEKNIITIDSINADFIAKSTVAPLMNLSLNSNIGEFLEKGELKTFFITLDEGTCSKVSVTGTDVVIHINERTLDEGFFKDGGELFEICSGFRLENKIIGNRFYMEKEIMEFSIKGWSPEDYGRVVLEITPEQNTNNLLDGLLGEMVPSGLPILSLPIE